MPTIRKYENRRLYDTEASRYVNLEDIAVMVRSGAPVVVEDVKTGRDLTRETLLQVLLASEGGADLLPIGMLRRIIRATGDEPLQRMLRPHIGSALELMHGQLDELEARVTSTFPNLNPAAWGVPMGRAAAPPPPPPSSPPPAPPAEENSLAAMRRRLDELEGRLRGR